MDPMTATGAYGFGSYDPSSQATAFAQTSAGSAQEAVPAIIGSFGQLGHTNNPLFWLLLLALVFTGYVFGVFEVGVKKVGSVGVRVGEK